MTTAVRLCHQALIMVGAKGMQSFDEGTSDSEVAAALYGECRDMLLSAHPWKFAFRQAQLPRLAADPNADFKYQFQMPADVLAVRSVGIESRGRGEVYRIVGSAVQADADEIILSYIRQVPENEFPVHFRNALLAALAAEFCIPLTDSTTRWSKLIELAEVKFARARRVDDQQQTPPSIESFPLVEVR